LLHVPSDPLELHGVRRTCVCEYANSIAVSTSTAHCGAGYRGGL